MSYKSAEIECVIIIRDPTQIAHRTAGGYLLLRLWEL